VVVDHDDVVVAYASLSMTAIDVSAASAPLAKNAPDPIPALLVGRLGVDKLHASQGLGTALVAHVLATVVELNQQAACRAVVVTAINERSRSWWEYLGFSPMDPDEPEDLDLYLLTEDIEATLRVME
jgi:GNAT superfamily N-acetyltransferase